MTNRNHLTFRSKARRQTTSDSPSELSTRSHSTTADNNRTTVAALAAASSIQHESSSIQHYDPLNVAPVASTSTAGCHQYSTRHNLHHQFGAQGNRNRLLFSPQHLGKLFYLYSTTFHKSCGLPRSGMALVLEKQTRK